MKNFLLSVGLGCILVTPAASAQGIRIMPGTTFKMIGSPYQIVLFNGAHFENNAAVNAPTLTIRASGAGTSDLKGAFPLSVSELVVHKDPGQLLRLQKDVDVTTGITFDVGFLELNGHNIKLIDTAVLTGESEISRTIGSIGGYVQATRNLDAPLAENPGNLGLYIVSGANWGSTVVRRTHKVNIGPAGGSSIARSYDVIPTNNTNLFAFLRAYYMDGELGGQLESGLNFFQSDDGGGSWANRGNVGFNSTQNFVNVNGIQTMSLFTLASFTGVLPLQLTSINSVCINNKPRIEWTVGNIQGIANFQMEKSKDSRSWLAAGEGIQPESASDHKYRFTDIADPYPYYRLKAIEKDGTYEVSPVQSVNCNTATNNFTLLENPVQGALRIGVVTGAELKVNLIIYDLQGKEVMSKAQSINSGSSQLFTDISMLAPGTYQLKITERNEMIWVSRFIKP